MHGLKQLATMSHYHLLLALTIAVNIVINRISAHQQEGLLGRLKHARETSVRTVK